MSGIFKPDLASTSPLTTKGDVYTYSSQDARLAVGTNGQFLKANSAIATGLEWGAASQVLSFAAKSATYTVTTSDNYLIGDASGGTFPFLLPTAIGITGQVFEIEKKDSSFNAVFIQGLSLQPVTVFGATITTLNTQGEKLRLISDGATGYISERIIPSVWSAFSCSIIGWGTCSLIDIKWMRHANNIRMKGKVLLGTRTVSEVRIPLPIGLTTSADIASYQLVGDLVYSGGSTGVKYNMMADTSLAYLNISFNGNGSFVKETGTALLTDNSTIAFWSEHPVAGWNG